MARYFASRGQGLIQGDPTPYTSPAKVVLSGLGSDELLGGYGRHRSAYNSGGWKAVIEEVRTLGNKVGRLTNALIVAIGD